MAARLANARAIGGGAGWGAKRYTAIIGGLAGFAAGFGGCAATAPEALKPGYIATTLVAGAICSLPGLIVGFLFGKTAKN